MEYRVCCPEDENARKEWEESLQREKSSLPPEETSEKLRRIFETLSNPIRLEIAFHLLLKDYCVCELVFLLGLERNLVSYHLREMRKGKIISAYMRSGWKYYRLNENAKYFLSQRFNSPSYENGYV